MQGNGKVAVVTGGTRGIGRTVAQRLHNAGMRVAIIGRDSESLKQAALEIGAEGSPVLPLQANVQKLEDVEQMIKTVVEAFGRLDILVNNAGIIRDRIILDTTLEDWNEVMDTNLTGAFLCTKYAAKEMMLKRFGRIINISSVAARGGGAGQAAYAASKSGLEAFTRIAAVELGRRNITVNAIAPGSIRTDMTRELLDEREKEITRRIPLKRIGEPEDVAEMVLFLASEEASYLTGEVIHITGGLGLTYKL